ncbi:MAG: hypothetical protein ACP5VR_10390 [Acidimicrobiales bacterium]
MSRVNLSERAWRVGVSKFTAYRWWREGSVPMPATRAGRLALVDVDGPRRGCPDGRLCTLGCRGTTNALAHTPS